MIYLFLIFCRCSQRKYTIKTFMPVSPLDSFGFDANGTFEIILGTKNRSTLIIFLATFEEMKARILHEISFTDICLDPTIHLSSLNSSFKKNVNIVKWYGVIRTKNIYYPYILNCNRTKAQYSVMTNFTNPDSHLDLRDELYPYFDITLSYIYLGLTAICLLDFLIFQNFGIFVPLIIACIASTKCMIMSKYAQIWLDRRQGIVSYDYYGNIFFNFIYLLHYTAFFSFPTFIIAGWCVYRDTFNIFEVLIIIVSSLIFVVGVWSFRFTLSLKDAFVSIGFIMIGFLSMIRNNVSYIMMTGHLDDIISRDLVQFRMKISLVIQFDVIYLSSLVLLALLFSMTVSFDFWPIASDIIFELLLLVITVSEMYLFLYRRGFAGDPSDADIDPHLSSRSIENNENLRFYMLNEPNSNCVALIAEP